MKTKLALLTVAIIAVAATPALVRAQVFGQQSEIVEKNVKKDAPPATTAPAPAVQVNVAPAPAPAPKAAEKKTACTLVTLAFPAVETKQKPVSYWPTLRDSADGFADDMRACNPKSEVIAPVSGSTKTVRMKVTQGADGMAYFKLPTARAGRILLTFHVNSSVQDWTKARAWGVTGPVGERTELVMEVQDEKSFPKLSTN